MSRRNRAGFSQWAAVPSGRRLALAHLGFDGIRLTVLTEKVFELRADSQIELHAFAWSLNDFLTKHGASHLIVRSGQTAGLYQASHMASKMEAVLAFLPEIVVDSYGTMKIWGWDHRTQPDLPKPPGGSSKRDQQLYLRAYEAAGFGIDLQLAAFNAQPQKFSPLASKEPPEWDGKEIPLRVIKLMNSL